MAAPTRQTFTTAEGSSATASSNKPTSVAVGDLLIAVVDVEGGTNITVTTPAGWALILGADNSSNVGLRVYSRIADGSEGASFSFTLNTSCKWCCGVGRITGHDADTFLNVSAAGNGASGNPTSPSVTTTVDDCLILRFVTNKKAATYTPPASHTEWWDDPNNAGGVPSNAVMDRVWTTAGAVGTASITASETAEWAAVTIAIAPDSGRPRVATGSSSTTGDNINSLTWSHTVPSGSNRLLIVGVSTNTTVDVVTGVTFGGVGLTRLDIGDSAFNVRAYFYYLVAPTVQTADIVVSLSTAPDSEAGAVNITGAHQSTPFGTLVHGGADNTNPSLSVSSANNELVIDVVSAAGSSLTLTVGADQTERIKVFESTDSALGMSTEPGVSSTTMSWTINANSDWSAVAAAIKPEIAAPPPTVIQDIIGCGVVPFAR